MAISTQALFLGVGSALLGDGVREGLYAAFICVLFISIPGFVIGSLIAIASQLPLRNRSLSFAVGGISANALWLIALFTTAILFAVALASTGATILVARRLR